MSKRVCVITGGNSGIGKTTAIELAKQGHTIIMLARESQKSDEAKSEIMSASGNKNVHHIKVDLSEIESIRSACNQVISDYPAIDYLINNAGVLKRKSFNNSKGVEQTLAVNYLAPLLITRLLLEKLQSSENASIMNVTSALYKKGKLPKTISPKTQKFNGNQAYSDSKLLVLLDTIYLSRKYVKTGISINCMHPGVVGTDVFRDYPKWIASLLNLVITKPEKAGLNLSSLMTDIDSFPESGQYYNIKKLEAVEDLENLMSQYNKLVRESEKMVEM